jgi:hypothetical protein
MAAKAANFKPWWRRENKRPSLPLHIGPYWADQIALHVDSVPETIHSTQKAMGPDNQFFVDVVMAEDDLNQEEFTVMLAFNYTLWPVEFELLQLLDGSTYQLQGKNLHEPGMSHIGFHVEDMNKAISYFEEIGYELQADVRTMWHSSHTRRYRYTYFNTQNLGFVTKLITEVK